MNLFGVWTACAICLMVSQLPLTSQLPHKISIGGLFDVGDVKGNVAFRYAIENINKRHSFRTTILNPIINRIPAHDSFLASKRVCELVKLGVAAIFGPQSGQTSAHVQSICDALEIPHIETRWDYRVRRDDYSVNLYPHPSSLSLAYLALVRLFGWKSFCILYEDNEGLVRLQELLKTPPPNEFKVTIRQLPRDNDFRPVLREVKNSLEQNIILDCRTEKVGLVLKQAQQIGLMSSLHNYIITSLDLHLVDLEDFKYSGSNITALRLVDPEREEVKRLMEDWQIYAKQDEMIMKTETALIYDAVKLFVKAIQELDNSTDVQMVSLTCEGEDAWIHGNSLINYMKMVNFSGLTGFINFDALGFRTDFALDIVELGMQNLTKVGTWRLKEGTNYTKTYQETLQKVMDGLQNKTLIVSVAFNDPYIMLKESSEKLTGNDRYEGFCIDLLEEIAEILKFNFTIVPTTAYGSKNEHGEWNGMIRELLDQRADMAVTDLTINYEREQAVDFTMPFMNLGISILFKKPQKMAPSLFSFLSPLSLEVWIYMITAYVGVSILMYILARFTPYEWQNPHPCDPDPDTLENQFTILNCLWFAIGSLMQQGCDFLPQAVSTRMVAGMWWFFTLIMISSYTANLAAFLTVERMESPIESAEDLAKQTKIKYGSLGTGTTMAFFRDSKIPTYQTMWNFMKRYSEPGNSVFTATNAQGVARVQKSNGLYAYLMESTSIEYQVERNCDLTQIGGLLDSKSYGIALPPESPYKDQLDVTILTLQSRGRFHALKEKWFRQKRGGGKCKEEAGGSSMASELNLSNVGGVFVVLLGGMVLALLVALAEFVLECWDISKEDEKSIINVLSEELCFVFQCKGSTKPVRKKAEADPTAASDNMYGSDIYNCSGRNPLT